NHGASWLAAVGETAVPAEHPAARLTNTRTTPVCFQGATVRFSNPKSQERKRFGSSSNTRFVLVTPLCGFLLAHLLGEPAAPHDLVRRIQRQERVELLAGLRGVPGAK